MPRLDHAERRRIFKAASTPRVRGVELEATAAEDLSYIIGRAAPYNLDDIVAWGGPWGGYRERLLPGVFSKSIKESAFDLPLLLHHDRRSLPVGKAEEWTENESGLFGQWAIDRDDPDAVKAARKARDGYLSGLSVGYIPMTARDKWTWASEDDWDPDDPLTWDLVERAEARLVETSLVTTPAWAEAHVMEVRSAWRPQPVLRPAAVIPPHTAAALEWLAKIKS